MWAAPRLPSVLTCAVCPPQALLEDCPLDPESPEVGGLMAVLAVIGGIDGRLRLGGQVTHEEFGEGTVTRITPKGRITVQFSDMRACRVCPLSQLKPVGGLCSVPQAVRQRGLVPELGSHVGARACCASRLPSGGFPTSGKLPAFLPGLGCALQMSRAWLTGLL